MRRNHASFSSFVEYAANNKAARGEDYSRSNGRDFTGSDSFPHALTIANEGWQDGRDEMEKHRAAFSAIVGNRVRRAVLSHDMVGFAPDVGAFLQGEPECMFSREHVDADAPGKIVRVVVNGTVSSSISAGQIIRRGAMICALIDGLESAGHSCELVVCFAAKAGAELAEDVILIKRAGEPLEIDRVAFVLAHPSMLRRIIFAAWEQDLPFIRCAGSGYGTPVDVPQADRGDLYFRRVHGGEVSDADVIPWFKAQLAPLGITFDD